MANRLHLRALSEEEDSQVRRLAASRAKPARLVQRAHVIEAMLDDPTLSAKDAGRAAGYAADQTGPRWVRRFNEGGLEALEDRPRSGRPLTHDETQRSKLLDLALQKPPSLGYPFALWTLERLQAALFERETIHLATSMIWEYVEAEGLHWKRQETWFHEAEKHDGSFAEKRGPSLQPTSHHRQAPA